MKLAVVGSRTWTDMHKICEHLYRINPDEIVSGGAVGADRLAEEWAIVEFVPAKVFKPDWAKFGKRAGAIRNQQIVDYCDKLIAFWDGTSKGAKISIEMARKADKLLGIVL